MAKFGVAMLLTGTVKCGRVCPKELVTAHRIFLERAHIAFVNKDRYDFELCRPSISYRIVARQLFYILKYIILKINLNLMAVSGQ